MEPDDPPIENLAADTSILLRALRAVMFGFAIFTTARCEPSGRLIEFERLRLIFLRKTTHAAARIQGDRGYFKRSIPLRS
jgi:hypothetical protein